VMATRAAAPLDAVPTIHASVVQALPSLSTRLDRWATHIELLPGEYRQACIELQGPFLAPSNTPEPLPHTCTYHI